MKRAIVIILVIILVAGGGAGGLMMLGVIPNPFNPTPIGAGMTEAERAAAELAAGLHAPAKPPEALLLPRLATVRQFVDMTIPQMLLAGHMLVGPRAT